MTKAEEYRLRADADERAAARTYNTVEYAECLERARRWRALADEAGREDENRRVGG